MGLYGDRCGPLLFSLLQRGRLNRRRTCNNMYNTFGKCITQESTGADVAGAGVAGGRATMMAKAAGPVIQLCLLSRRIPKMEMIGISARCFLLINLIKVPMTVHLSLTTGETLKISFLLVPGVWLGVATGKFLVKRVPQRWFEGLVIAFSLIAGLRLCLF